MRAVQPYTDRQYAATVVGFGAVGRSVAEMLAEHPSVARLYLSNRNAQRVAAHEAHLTYLARRSAGQVPGAKIERVEFSEVGTLAVESDLTFIVIGKAFDAQKEPNIPPEVPAEDRELYERALALYHFALDQYPPEERGRAYRLSSCIDTLPAVIKLARIWGAHRDEVRGQIGIISNPTDIAAYAFAAQSGLHFQTAGVNHVDTYRLRSFVVPEAVNAEIQQLIVQSSGHAPVYLFHDGSCIGDHGTGVIPLLADLKLDGGVPLTTWAISHPQVYQNLVDFAVVELTRDASTSTTAHATRDVANALFSGNDVVELAIPATLRQLLAVVTGGAETRYADHPDLDEVLCLGWPVRLEGRTWVPQPITPSTDELARFVKAAERYRRITDKLCELFDLERITAADVADRGSRMRLPTSSSLDETVDALARTLHEQTTRTRELEMSRTGVYATLAEIKQEINQERSSGQKIFCALGDLVKKLEPLDKIGHAIWQLVANIGSTMSAANPALSTQIDIHAQYATAQAHYAKYKALEEQGCIAQAETELDAAGAEVQRLLQRDPGNAPVHNLHGRILRREGKLEEACQSFRAACANDPNNADYTHNLAVALYDGGNAASALQTLYGQKRTTLPLLTLAARIEKEQGNLDDAEAVYFRITEEFPAAFIGWYGLGVLAHRRGEPHIARQHLTRARAYLSQAIPDDQRDLDQLLEQLSTPRGALHV